jgi:hypothetical protein
MFRASIIRYNVKLKVTEVGRNVSDVVEARARKMLEGTCSYVGFTKPGSLRLVQMGPGVLSAIDMGRHYSFQCSFAGEVCNPPAGSRFKAYVRSINRFGMLVEAGYLDPMGTLVPVVELVVIRDPTIARNEVPIDDLALGDAVGVEVLGRRFDLRDTRITGFARTVFVEAEAEDGGAMGLSTARRAKNQGGRAGGDEGAADGHASTGGAAAAGGDAAAAAGGDDAVAARGDDAVAAGGDAAAGAGYAARGDDAAAAGYDAAGYAAGDDDDGEAAGDEGEADPEDVESEQDPTEDGKSTVVGGEDGMDESDIDSFAGSEETSENGEEETGDEDDEP